MDKQVEQVLANPADADPSELKDVAQTLLEQTDRIESAMRDTIQGPGDGIQMVDNLGELADQHEETMEKLGRIFLYWREQGGTIRLVGENANEDHGQDLVGGGVDHLREVVSSLDAIPEDFRNPIEAAEEMDRLEHAFERKKWESYPKQLQQLILGYITTRARWLQSALSSDLMDRTNVEDRLDHLFPSLTKFSSEEEPGFVYGLGRDHTPDYGDSWLDDARHWKQRLERRLRMEEDRDSRSDWESFYYTNDALVIGNLENTDRIETIRSSFGFDNMQVIDPTDREALRTAQKDIQSGSVNAVLCLSEPVESELYETLQDVEQTCEGTEIPFVSVREGSGTEHIQDVLEQHLGETAA